MNPLEVWRELEQAGHGATGYAARRVPGQRDLRLAVRYPGAIRVLLLGFPRAVFPGQIEIPESTGFVVSTAELPEGNEQMQVEVALRSSQFEELFGGLVQDLIDKMSDANDDSTALASLLIRLQQWQRFLARMRPEGLSREEQIGLWGELWTLRDLVVPAVGVHAALTGWNGPNGGNQDFRVGEVAIEVKTSTALEPLNIRITNERQLDDTGLLSLFLVQVSVSRDSGGGEALQQAVQAVRDIASSVGLQEHFEELLANYGYFQDQLPDYRQYGYTMLGHRQYEVIDGFPRLIQSSLPDGIGEVHYSVSTVACQPFAVSVERLVAQLQGENRDAP